jgi:hypothetical protein
MRTTLQIVALLASLVVASAASASTKYAQTDLPDCDSAAKIVIFHGESFEGTVYLHDADVQLSKANVYAVRQIAELGQTPVICQDSGVIVVTAAQTVDNGLDSEVE